LKRYQKFGRIHLLELSYYDKQQRKTSNIRKKACSKRSSSSIDEVQVSPENGNVLNVVGKELAPMFRDPNTPLKQVTVHIRQDTQQVTE